MKNLITKLKSYWHNLLNFFVWLFQWIILFKPYWKKFVRLLVNWHEIMTIPIGLAIFYFFPRLLRLMDPTAGAYDAGVLHSAIVAIAIMLILHGFVWLILKLTFPGVYKFLDDIFEEHILENPGLQPSPTERDKMFYLTTFQKCVLSIVLFAVYFFGTILVLKVF